MRKLQKTQLLISCATILCCAVITVLNPVKAEASETAFTNLNGAVLSQEQYSRLLKYFDTDTINTMSKSLLDSVKNDNSLKAAADQERYIRQDIIYDKSGNVISETETDISAEDAYCMRTPAV